MANKKKTPAWGSPEMQKSIEEHDKKADPEREKKGLDYTKKPKNSSSEESEDE